MVRSTRLLRTEFGFSKPRPLASPWQLASTYAQRKQHLASLPFTPRFQFNGTKHFFWLLRFHLLSHDFSHIGKFEYLAHSTGNGIKKISLICDCMSVVYNTWIFCATTRILSSHYPYLFTAEWDLRRRAPCLPDTRAEGKRLNNASFTYVLRDIWMSPNRYCINYIINEL